MRRAASVLAVACVCASGSARADELPHGFSWLPGAARGVTRTTSASRDAPVLELAYGPRAQASLGVEPALFAVARDTHVWRVGVSALAALENRTSSGAFATELWRSRVELFAALALKAGPAFPRGTVFELSIGAGRERADHFGFAKPPPPPAWAMPFGGGGDWFSFDAAMRAPLGERVELSARWTERAYWAALVDLAGQRTAADTAASTLREGPSHVVSAEAAIRWRALDGLHPTVAVYAEHAFARDDFTADTFFFRGIAGAALPGRRGELMPFASIDAGNGRGLLVDRRELRLSLGVRHVFQ